MKKVMKDIFLKTMFNIPAKNTRTSHGLEKKQKET